MDQWRGRLMEQFLFYSVQHSNLDQSNYDEKVSPIQSQRKPGCDKKKYKEKNYKCFRSNTLIKKRLFQDLT